MPPMLSLDVWYRVYALLCDFTFEQEYLTGVHDGAFFRELSLQRLACRDLDRAIRPHTYRTIYFSTPTMVAALTSNHSSAFLQFLTYVKNHTRVIELAMRRIDPTARRIAELISECQRLNHIRWRFIPDPQMSRTSALYLGSFSANNTKATFVAQAAMVHIATFEATPERNFQPTLQPEEHHPTFLRNQQIRIRDAEYTGPDPLQEVPPTAVRDVLDLRADDDAFQHYQHLRSFGQLLPAPKRLVLTDLGASCEMVELGPGLLDLTSLASATIESANLLGLLNMFDAEVQARMRYLEIIDCFIYLQPESDDEVADGGVGTGDGAGVQDDDNDDDNTSAPDLDVIETTFQGMQNLESLRIHDTWRGIFSPLWLFSTGDNLREFSLRSLEAGAANGYAIAMYELDYVRQHCSNIIDLEIDFDTTEVEREEIQQVLSSFSNLQYLRLSTYDPLWRDDVPEDRTDKDLAAAIIFITNLNLMKIGDLFQEITVRACCDDPNSPQGFTWRAFKSTRDQNGLVDINEI